MKGSRKYVRVLGLGLGIAVTGLLGWRLISDWENFTSLCISPRPLPLLFSFLFFFLGFLSLVQGWRFLVSALGCPLGLKAAFSVVIRASLGRYIPGKIWAAAGLVYLGRSVGVSARVGTIGALLSTLLLMLSGGLLSIYRLQLLLNPFFLIALGVGAVIIILAVLHPAVFSRINRLFSRGEQVPCPQFSYLRILGCFPFYLGFWVLMGIGFVLAVSALTGSIDYPLELGSSYALAYTGGLAAIIVPGGLGIREGLLAWSLEGLCDPALPAAIGIFARLWATVGEALLFIFTFLPGIRIARIIDELP